jgi:6-pyruvoyl-tetrahydropterin synthase
MNTLFVDQLTVIDFSYLHETRGLMGESWIVDCELEGELNEQGMLFDFGHVKKVIKNTIDDFADHKLIVATQDKHLTIQNNPVDTSLEWHHQGRLLQTTAPNSAFLFIDEPSVTIASLTPYIEAEIKKQLPDNVLSVKLSLYEESIQGAFYHYSHGLKKHDGNCQRIAHGHRSPIEIYLNQKRDNSLEAVWAKRFEDIYIGTREDITAEQVNIHGIDCTSFKYQAPQGHFSLSIGNSQCYIIDTDSTVEWIAQHIAEQLKASYPNDQIRVKAFEGYRKGSIAQR